MMFKKLGALRGRRALLSRGAVYLFFAFFNRSLPFLLLPVYSRCLTPEDYGVYALFLTAVTIANPFLTLCWHNALAYIYFNESFEIRRYVSSFLLVSLGLLALQEGALYLLTFVPLGRWAVPTFLLLAPVNALGMILISVVAAMWQVRERPLAFGLFQLFCAAAKATMNLCSVFLLRLGWRGLLASETLFYLIGIAVSLTLLYRAGWLGWAFDRRHLKVGLKLGLGFFPGTLANILNDSIGRILLADRFSVDAVGVYSMGQKLGTVAGLYTTSLHNVYQPWFFKKVNQGGKDLGRKIFRSLVLASSSILIFSGTAGLAMQLISSFVLGSAFRGAMPYFWLSLLSFSIVGIYGLLGYVIYSTGRTWILSCLTGMAALTNISLTWIFLNVFGVIGAGYASVLAWLLILLVAIPVTLREWRRHIARPLPTSNKAAGHDPR